MKIAIHTSALDSYISGGILCIVSVLEELKCQGHDVCCFVDIGKLGSTWLKHTFPVYPSDSQEYRKFDGILVSPFSPTAKAVANHDNAADRFYHVHTNEGLFTYNGLEWTQQAIDSYSLPLKIFCTSHYVRIIMEMQYKRNVIGKLVPPGFCPLTFSTRFRERICYPGHDEKLRIVVFGRQDRIRGVDVALAGIREADKYFDIDYKLIPDGIRNRTEVARYFEWADLYIDASRLAGSPTPVKEAMACGAVPIATPYGTTDFVLDGFNGYIVPVDDPKAIANKIFFYGHDLCAEGRAKMHANACITMNGHYEWYQIANKFKMAIEEGQRRTDLLELKRW